MRVLESSRTRPVTGIGISPDSRTLIAGGDDGFDVYDLTSGTATSVHVAERDPFAFVVDPMARRVYISEVRAGCWIYDLPTGQGRRFAGSDHHVISIATSGDGSRVALSRGGSHNHRLECWAFTDDEPSLLWSHRPDKRGHMTHALAFHPTAERLVVIEDEGGTDSSGGFFYRFDSTHAIVVRDATNGVRLRTLGAVPETLYARAGFFAATNEYAVWDSRGIHLFDIDQHRRPRTRRHPGSALFRGVGEHPSGRFFCTVANDGIARYWDLATLTQTQAFAWKAGKLQSFAFSPDGMLAAAGTDKGKVVLWDVDA